MNNESALLKKFLLEYSQKGWRLFRCNTGKGWTGNKCIMIERAMTTTLQAGDMVIRSARPFRTGWPKGTPDLIGWTKVTITKDMIGRELAIFTAVEGKTPTVKATKEQTNFINLVNKSGGIAMIARELKDVFDVTTNFLRRDSDEARH